MTKLAIILDEYTEARNIIAEHLEDDNILFELRIDRDMELLKLFDLDLDPKRFIVTLRSNQEGGFYGNYADRHEILLQSASYDPGFIDLEIEHDLSLVPEVRKRSKSNIILSKHDFTSSMSSTAENFFRRTQELEEIGNIDNFTYKFVGKPRDILDYFKAHEILHSSYSSSIILGVDPAGDVSRTCAPDLKQELVYGATRSGNLLRYDDLKPLVLRENQPTYTGLIGSSLSHSLSPEIQKLFMQETNMHGYYHLLELEQETDFPLLIEKLRELNFKGVNVTFPYKKFASEFADVQCKHVQITNSSNTLVFANDRIEAYNTDVSGFSQFLKNHFLDKYDSALIFGAGGAARSIALALIENNFDVTIVNRSKERMNEFPEILSNQINFKLLEEYKRKKKDSFDMFINATSLGMGNIDPHHVISIPPNTKFVIDALYAVGDTSVVKAARQAGINAFDGKEMLFYQALDAYALWTGKELDRENTFLKFIEHLNRYDSLM